MDLLIITYRTIIFYFIIMISYRIMGKREIGQLGITDLTVSILIAELVAISIENYKDTIWLAMIPIITLILLELLLAYISIKSKKMRNIFDGKPSIIIANGIVNYKEMSKLRYSLDDLLVALRQKEIKSIEDVEYAFLETNGKLSIFPYNNIKKKSNYPMPIIIDGKIDYTTLKYIKKNKIWLCKKLDDNKLRLEDILYAFYKKHNIYFISK